MLRYLLILLIGFLQISCSGNLEEKLANTDKLYGKCDNPHRVYNPREYKICKAQEAAGKGDFKGISLGNLLGNKDSQSVSGITTNVNSYLWAGSLVTLEEYSLKTADSIGGYIETDWISEVADPNTRCAIKVLITSPEFISTGIKTFVNCQNYQNGNWVKSNQDLTQAEKQLTLKILSNAQESYLNTTN
jgi:hypothetical protein